MEHFSVVFLLYLLYCSLIRVVETTVTPNCTMYLEFIEVYDGTCKNYYLCTYDGAKFIPVPLSCTSTTIFDPSVNMCMPESEAICQQTTTIPSTTVAPCYRYGRFPIADIYCKKYYLCYWDGIAYAKMDNLRCPNTLVFYPLSEKCVSPLKYKCPGTLV
ncbi:uncharacterized protein [Linepithema humile]|uniref:uncharacterized protein n=1 Tax=Linepithema humile TaxID=83485 RepID=UPI00351E2A88